MKDPKPDNHFQQKSRGLARSLFSNAGKYGVALILVRLGNLLLLPLFMRFLSAEDFAIIGLTNMVMTLLMPALCLGLQDAVLRFYFVWSEPERREALPFLLWAQILFSGACCGALVLFGNKIWETVIHQVPPDPYLALTLGTCFANLLSLIPMTTLRAEGRIRAYNTAMILNYGLEFILISFFVIYLRQGVIGYMYGGLISALVVGGILVFQFFLRHGAQLKPISTFREILNYTLPLSVSGLLEGFNAIFDRFAIDKFLPLDTIGRYTLGNQFGQGFNLFNQILKTSWFPFVFKTHSEHKDAAQLLGWMSTLYISLLSIPALAIASLSDEVIVLLSAQKYAGVGAYVPFFVLNYFIISWGAAMGRGAEIAKRNRLTALPSVFSILAGLALYPILTPIYGVWGALMALILTASLRIAVIVGLSFYYYPRPTYWKKLVAVLFALSVAFSLGWFLPWPDFWTKLIAKIIFIAAYVCVLGWVLFGWRHPRDFSREIRKFSSQL